MRKLLEEKTVKKALGTLKGKARIKRTMWSRRAQEYEAKINSGDPVSIAEVVRDLHRNADQPDQSYSERQIYQAALDRLVRELAAIDGIDETQATQRLHQVLKAAYAASLEIGAVIRTAPASSLLGEAPSGPNRKRRMASPLPQAASSVGGVRFPPEQSAQSQ
jgi:hypothetical protein